jgi:hypothetical protein
MYATRLREQVKHAGLHLGKKTRSFAAIDLVLQSFLQFATGSV